MSPEEKKSINDLRPYFSKYPVIFDVGSNKGEWTDLVVDYAKEVHLFEPNELLLHYTMVKYCDRPNVKYSNNAVWKRNSEVINFFYFTNENNGLSSLLDNPKWDYLPKRKTLVETVRLDEYADKMGIQFIDFIKLDIEGGEYEALEGCAGLLNSKRIKFIQVEKAEHLELAGHTFDDLTAYLKSSGYLPIETSDTENVIFAMEGFTQDWSTEFKKNTLGIKCDFALEIGAFEGLTSCYICDNMLNPGGRMIAVDPLTDEYLPGHPDNDLFKGQYHRFNRNIKGKPIELMRMKSDEAFQVPGFIDYRFDFIYIDGDHTEEQVLRDGINAFTVCKIGGYILFDDYEWREETKRGIDRFLSMYSSNKMIVILKDYQLMVKKLENL